MLKYQPIVGGLLCLVACSKMQPSPMLDPAKLAPANSSMFNFSISNATYRFMQATYTWETEGIQMTAYDSSGGEVELIIPYGEYWGDSLVTGQGILFYGSSQLYIECDTVTVATQFDEGLLYGRFSGNYWYLGYADTAEQGGGIFSRVPELL